MPFSLGPRDGPTAGASILLALLLVLACAGQVLAQIRFPPLTGRVVDLAELLSPAAEQALTDKLAAYEAQTSNQILVVTLPDLQDMDIADYGYQLGRRWGIGTKEHDNGALLIVAPNQRKVRIEVGYGLEGALTDALSRSIIEREILPRFKSGDMAGGISAGTDAMLQAVAGEYEAPETGTDGDDPFAFLGLTAAIGGMLGALARSRRWKARVGALVIPVAAVGTFLSGFSPFSGVGPFLVTLSILSAMGLMAFLIVGFSELARGGGLGRRGNGDFGSGGFGGGGFGGGGGSFGGGGASGSW